MIIKNSDSNEHEINYSTTGKELLKDKLDRKLFTIRSFDLGMVPAGQKIIPPRKVKVGVIVTTEAYGKYRVY